MKLFNFVEGSLQLHDSLTPLQCVRELQSLKYNAGKEWSDSDGRMRKRYNLELLYIFYVHSRMSPFKAYTEEDRIVRAKKDIPFPPNWKVSSELGECIKLIVELEDNTETKKTLRTVRKMLQSMRTHLEGVDFGVELEDGKMKYDITKYLAIADKIPSSLDKLKEIEEKADAEDSLEATRIKGGNKKGRREDPVKNDWKE
jgi:hypothetical protein